jgi:phage N-6-adenine-methyltransferase
VGDSYLPTEAKTVEHGTPPEVFDPLNKEFKFTLDVAASDENALCDSYYTKEDDGTKQDWGGHTVWCNPPFDHLSLKAFTQKAMREVGNGVLTALHVPAKTDQPWFHWLWKRRQGGIWYVDFRWIQGRVHYTGNEERAPFASLTVIIGPGG